MIEQNNDEREPVATAQTQWMDRTLRLSRRVKLTLSVLRESNPANPTTDVVQSNGDSPPVQQKPLITLPTVSPMIRASLYIVTFMIAVVLMLTQPPPLSTVVLVVVILTAAGIGWNELHIGTRLTRFSLPQPIAAHRNKLAFLFAAASFGLMIAAALDFQVSTREMYVNEGALKMLGGGALLGIAVALSKRLPAFPAVTPAALDRPRKRWWIPVVIGIALLLLSGEISAPRLNILALRSVSTHLQMFIFAAALIVLAWGMGGMPVLRFPRINFRAALPLIAIVILAFVLRGFGLDTTIRSSMDELHFTDGVMRVSGTPDLRLLTPMSGQSPFTWIFTYTQTLTTYLMGYNFAGFRFASAIMGVITVVSVYFMARALLDDRKTALLCALFLTAFAPHLHFSRSGIIQIADPLVGAIAIVFAARGLRDNRRIDWAFAGVGLGLTQYFYEGGRLLFPALMIVWLGTQIVLRRDHLRAQLPGIGIMIITGLLIFIPYYYVLTGNSDTLLGRMDDSGLGEQYWRNLLDDGFTLSDAQRVAEHFLSSFRIFVTHADLSAYYGGEQALIVDYLIPFFLFGAFYLFWRLPAAAIVIPLWILGTGFGNGLLRDTLVSSRYVIVTPALAIATAAGIRYLLPFVWTRRADTLPENERPPEFWLRYAIPVLMVGFFAAAQIHYYFYIHLDVFNVQIRNFKPYRDGIDVALRAAELPPNTQTIIVGRPQHDTIVPRNLLGYFTYGRPQQPPLLSFRIDQINPRFLLNLQPGQNYAFFVEADDMETMRLLMRYLPGLSAPQFSQTPEMPPHKEYVLFYLPAIAEPPRAPLK